jgi:hypothetical protein
MLGASLINVAVFFITVFLHPGLCAAEDILGYLLISTPNNGKVQYVKVPMNGDLSGQKPQTLIEGLQHPMGLALDHKRKRLLIADPDAVGSPGKILLYQLVVNGGTLSTDGQPPVAVSDNAGSRWVAVDGLGNVFFSNEDKSEILKIPIEKMLTLPSEAEPIYGPSFQQVKEPGGVAVDNFHVFWTNKALGTQSGTVVKGSENITPGTASGGSTTGTAETGDAGAEDNQLVQDMAQAQSFHIRRHSHRHRAKEEPQENPVSEETQNEYIKVLAQNSDKSYGICIALNNVFFTDETPTGHIYGVKKTGGSVATVNSGLVKPRGCVWDGDGTVFVADKGQNAIFSFPGNMHRITQAEVTKVLDVEDPTGLVFLSSASRTWPFTILLLVLTSALIA